MEFEVIIKIIGSVVAIFATWKIVHDVATGDKSQLREDYKFAKEFLEDVKNNPGLHPFAVEKGYQAIAGSTILSSEEIAYLISLKNPGKCLNNYELSRKYLQAGNTDGVFYLAFIRKYSSSWSRRSRKTFYFILYLILSAIAMSPIFVPPKFEFIIFMALYGFQGST